MTLAEQIDMVKLIRKTNHGEAKVWMRPGPQQSLDTAYVCRRYALTCTAVLKSLRRLQEMDEDARNNPGGTT